MASRVRAVVVAMIAVGCGAGASRAPRTPSAAVEITLYRDHAAIARRLEVDLPPAGTAHVRLRVAAGVIPDDVYLAAPTPLELRAVRVPGAPVARGGIGELGEGVTPPPPSAPSELELELAGPRAGRFAVVVGYDTRRIAWDARYTVTTAPGRRRAEVRGTLAVRNTTGLALRDVALWVADFPHGTPVDRVVERDGDRVMSRQQPGEVAGRAHPLGVVSLAPGETRIALLAHAAPRPLREVVIYDPIGSKLDYPGATPVRDRDLGVKPPAGPALMRALELARDPAAAGLPAGPVHVVERRPDGTRAPVADARLFEATTRRARVDRIVLGPARGLTGSRHRRELTVDDDRTRLAEEFLIAIESTRPAPTDVVVVEHLYRGRAWVLPYASLPLGRIDHEGEQQVAMHVRVPARRADRPGRLEVMYVVVYSWDRDREPRDDHRVDHPLRPARRRR